jgi:pyrimidine-specific ribonucleoside hydrolase
MEKNSKTKVMDVIFDMETNDPDDFLTLCILSTHPKVNLRAVTITPGSKHQVGLVKHTLRLLELKHVPVGSHNPFHAKTCVAPYHYRVLGNVAPEEPDGLGPAILYQAFKDYPNATIVTGAALHNMGELLTLYPDVKIQRWVAQGGFAGDNVVPEEYRLEKFVGKLTCPTCNFGGNYLAAEQCLADPRIVHRILVSKNVTHGIVYTPEWHKILEPYKDNSHAGFKLFYKAMEVYLDKKKTGKALHDPLAACAAIDPTIIETKEVELYHTSKTDWGSKLKEGSNTFISIRCDVQAFMAVLTGREMLDK